jgi:signal transduction histidine kinase
VAAASTVAAAFGYLPAIPIGPTVALYLLAASRTEAKPWDIRITTGVAVLFVAYMLTIGLTERALPAIEVFHTGLAWSVAWFAGERTRLRREYIAALREGIVTGRREAERERLLAVAEERTRIARDLHDSAAHAINVIAVRAGAARLGHDKHPERSRVALGVIEDVARQTVAEIDLFVGTLRDGPSVDGNVDAPPGLASLDTLLSHKTSAGLEVTVDTVGTPRPLSSSVDLAAYRILQEALTNAARHGSGPVRIRLGFSAKALELIVVNPVSEATDARASGGHGVIGMRERAALLGGVLYARRQNGEFRVQAELPFGGQLA